MPSIRETSPVIRGRGNMGQETMTDTGTAAENLRADLPNFQANQAVYAAEPGNMS